MKGRANFLKKYHLCPYILWGYHIIIINLYFYLLYIIHWKLDFGATRSSFHRRWYVADLSSEVNLLKKKKHLKIKSRTAYLDFSQTPQNMGVLCSRYNILTHHVFVGLIWLFHTICSRVKFYIGLDVHAYILGNACCSWYFLRGCNFGRRLTLASLMFWFSSITFRLAIFSVSFFFGGRDMVRHISFINAELLLNFINIISPLLY